jgi:hypothetical protein
VAGRWQDGGGKALRRIRKGTGASAKGALPCPAGEVASFGVGAGSRGDPYAAAALSAYDAAVLARGKDDLADATVGAGRRVLQRIFGRREDGEELPAFLAEVSKTLAPRARDARRSASRQRCSLFRAGLTATVAVCSASASSGRI